MEKADAVYEYEHSNGVIEYADRQDALSRCPVLGRLAMEAPDQIDVVMEMMAKGKALLAEEQPDKTPTPQPVTLAATEAKATFAPEPAVESLALVTRDTLPLLALPELQAIMHQDFTASTPEPLTVRPEQSFSSTDTDDEAIRTVKHIPTHTATTLLTANLPPSHVATPLELAPTVAPTEIILPKTIPENAPLEIMQPEAQLRVLPATDEAIQEILHGSVHSQSELATEMPELSLPAPIMPEAVSAIESIDPVVHDRDDIEPFAIAETSDTVEPLHPIASEVLEQMQGSIEPIDTVELTDLLAELATDLTVVSNEMLESAAVPAEIIDKILVVLAKIGYEQPEQALESFLQTVSIEELVQIITQAVQHQAKIESPEFLKSTALSLGLIDLSDQTHSRLGKLLLSLLARPAELAA